MLDEWLTDYAALPIENSASCLGSEQSVTESAAIALQSINRHGFGFFDLDMDPLQHATLSNMMTSRFANYEAIVSTENIDAKVAALVNTLLAMDNSPEACEVAAYTVIKVVRAILAASERQTCKLALRTHPPTQDHELYWHVDKSLQEMVGTGNSTNPIFIFVLKGDGTLFYPLDARLRIHWSQIATEHPNDYGGWHTQYLFPDSIHVHHTPYGKGSIHLSGYNIGAIHSPPRSDSGRLLAVVSPGEFIPVLLEETCFKPLDF